MYKEFIEKLENNSLVYFWAEWCGPCKSFAPIFEKISKEIKDVNFIKININEDEELCKKIGIMSVPTVQFYSNYILEDEFSGAVSEEELINFINENSN